MAKSQPLAITVITIKYDVGNMEGAGMGSTRKMRGHHDFRQRYLIYVRSTCGGSKMKKEEKTGETAIGIPSFHMWRQIHRTTQQPYRHLAVISK